MKTICEHCLEFKECTEIGKRYLCNEHKDLKQYKVKEKKIYTLKRIEIKPKKNYRIPKVSKKRAKENTEYNLIAKKFKKDNPICSVGILECTRETMDVHHKKGRVGYVDDYARENEVKLLVDVRFFLPVCRTCHTYIEEHSEWAYEKGYSIRRNEK